MELRHYLTCLWPGLAELWWRGRLLALPQAIAFALGLNLLLIMRFIYPQWLSGTLVHLGCWVAVAAWIFFVVRSVRELPLIIAPRTVSEEPDRFGQAQYEYLQANWTAAEQLLLGVLAIEPRDPPALLLLSGVYRHTDRSPQAELLMRELSRLEIADGWCLEIEAEQGRIARSIEASGETQESTGSDNNCAADLTAA